GETGQVIKSAVRSTVENTVQSTHSITTEATPALQAAETGATSNASDESMIETRNVVNTHGVAETSLEAFYGRAGLVAMFSTDGGIYRWYINFGEYVQLRAKLELLTYARFDMEFTIVAQVVNAQSKVQDFNVDYQVMFVPPGASVPENQDSYQWQSSCNPSVISNTGLPPARVSVPFMSSANAYSFSYDGYTQFGDTSGSSYGIVPSNYLGMLVVRTCEDLDGTRLRVRVYAKPKHVKGWIPRSPRMTPYKSRYTGVYTDTTKFCANRARITTAG
nr:Chain A, VP1 [Enterovirus F]6T48_A Chain A, VP1 [Enterovirus F]6T4C_A Chain A, VP1 [Enterovirus F]